jgi:hypothetical protein
MGYGEVGGGGSLQFSVVYDTPVRKPNVPAKVHQYGVDRKGRNGDPLVVVVKFKSAEEAKARTRFEPDGSVTLLTRINDAQPDTLRVFWPPFVGPGQPPLPLRVVTFAVQSGVSRAQMAARSRKGTRKKR